MNSAGLRLSGWLLTIIAPLWAQHAFSQSLSLQFQDIDVRRALQILATKADQNIVISDAVSGRLSVNLQAVSWRQAMDLVLRAHNLGEQHIGEVLLIAPTAEIAASKQAELQHLKDLQQVEPLSTALLQVRYAQATALAKLIAGKGNRLLTKRGGVSVDERTNTLVVTDVPERLAWVRKTLAQIDVPLRQVQIEARIAIVNSGLSEQFGVRWHMQGSEVDAATAQTEIQLGAGALAQGVGVTTLELRRANGNAWLDAQLSALVAKGQARVLARPGIMTLDNATALIESGVEIAYQEVSTSGSTSTAFKEATLSLAVAPQITPDGQVIMGLQIKQDTVGQLLNGVPSINTNRMETRITVAHGQTLVLGGILQTDYNQSTTRTPLMSSLPLVGRLFRHRIVRDDQQELLVFVTPVIVQAPAAEMSIAKPMPSALFDRGTEQ